MVLKTITLQEANGLLPLVREKFFHMQVLVTHLQRLQTIFAKRYQEKHIIDLHSEEIIIIEKKYYGKRRRKKAQEISKIKMQIEQEMIDLIKLGAITRSHFPAHVDFLSQKNGQLIFLCWHGHEKEISHWHHLDDRPPQRQSVIMKNFFGPQVVH